MKRTPLKPGKPLRAKTMQGYNSTIRPGGRLPRTSARKRSEIRERAPHNAELRAGLHECIAQLPGCTGTATDWDERMPRSVGGSATDPANRQNLCRPCHQWKTTHPVEAAKLGLHEFRRGNG